MVRARKLVIVVWVILALVGLLAASQVSKVLTGDVTRTPGSESDQLDQLVHAHFDRQFPHTLLVTFTSPRWRVDDPPYLAAIQQVKDSLNADAKVGSIMSHVDDDSLISADRHHTFLLVGLRVDKFPQAADLVKPLGKKLHALPMDPEIHLAITGNAAISVDMERTSSIDGARTESRVVPLAVVVMIFLFGALVAALVPVAIGLVACTMAFAALYLIGHFIELNLFAQNFVTMMGLGVGIDYSLFIVSRFREELVTGKDKVEAAIRATETAGRSIAFSGVAVSIGSLALLIPNLPLTRALGIAGLLVVLMTVILSLTLLPAVLATIGDRINSPRAFNRLILKLSRSKEFWNSWSQQIMARPVMYLTLSVAVLVAFSVFAFELKTWNSNILLMPERLEARQGYQVLTQTAGERQISPIGVGIAVTDETTLFHPPTLKAVYDFSKAMQAALPLSRVISIVDLNPRLTYDDYQGMMQNSLTLRIFNPSAQNPLISRDDQKTLWDPLESTCRHASLSIL